MRNGTDRISVCPFHYDRKRVKIMRRVLCAATVCMLLISCCLAETDSTGGVEDLNRVFYEIFVGSFSDSDGDGVGDLRGIINRMDYLNDGNPGSKDSLGIEGIWLTPIFASPSYHKYDVTDFYAIDPAFGTVEDLKELISLCHERNVKLIIDLPLNHTSTQNRWFKNFMNAHMMKNPTNEYYDYYVWIPEDEASPAGRQFTASKQAKLKYESNFSDAMPELNYDLPAVRKAALDVGLYYLDLGVDGFRFDAAKYIYLGDNPASVDFWQWYVGELRKAKPDLYTVAEVWDGEGVIDQYLSATNCFNFTAAQQEGLIAETAKAGNVNRFTAYIQKYQEKIAGIGPYAMNTLFVSNHDMDRAAGYLPLSNGQMKMAANLYLLSPGSPFIYYGEEIGMKGSRGGANTDANRRLAMLWGDGDPVQDPVGTTYDMSKQTANTVRQQLDSAGSLFHYYGKLLKIRRDHPAIARGTYTALSLADSKAGGFISTWKGTAVAVFHNTTTRDMEIDLSACTAQSFDTLSAFIGLGEAYLEGTILTLEGQTSAVLTAASHQ
ncbi:MAG: hypothetical protein IK099_09255 [Clostridia bacterium]|nr:hypothetical protein [Clostridia bacterium]